MVTGELHKFEDVENQFYVSLDRKAGDTFVYNEETEAIRLNFEKYRKKK